MPSASLRKWISERTISLDEIENAHLVVGGTGRGRRYATQQINHAYVMLLSSQFQGFCRDLHTECADYLVRGISPTILREAIRAEFVRDRKLDKGNPSPGNIGNDFNRLGLAFWTDAKARDQRNVRRQASLILMNEWRNAIAHQDFDPGKLGGTITVGLRQVRDWRRACHGLTQSFDEVIRAHLQSVTGTAPW